MRGTRCYRRGISRHTCFWEFDADVIAPQHGNTACDHPCSPWPSDPQPTGGLRDRGCGRRRREGFHNGAGTDHAEIVALTELDPALDPAELTAVVTLEPCNHTGKTPPCAQALLASGIGTIVYGQPDIGAQSSGGATTLFAHGRQVIGGIESAATAELIAPCTLRLTSHEVRSSPNGLSP